MCAMMSASSKPISAAANMRSARERPPHHRWPDCRLWRPADHRQYQSHCRAGMSEPLLLLLDEPTAGLSPAYLERIFDLILNIRKAGVTILMVEQNARQALSIADRAYVLVNGRNFASDTGANLLASDEIR